MSTPAERVGADGMSAIWFRYSWLILFGIFLVGLILRLWGLDAKGLSHPEIYIPGLDLPPGISEPPPRHEFFETLRWHFFSEPHPLGYYMAMWAWTKLVGATAFTIRLPEALLGALCIPLLYRIGELTFGRRTGLLAAAMLALHGFHIYWSQTARMYAPGAFFGLLATLCLLELLHRRPRSNWLVAGYIFAIVSCAATVEFAWALLAVHLLWAVLHPPANRAAASRLTVMMSAAAIVAMPMLSQAVISARRNAAPLPTLSFLEDYFSLGFLFQHGGYSEPVLGPSPIFQFVFFLLCLAALIAGIGRLPIAQPDPERATTGWWRALLPVGLCTMAVMAWLAFISDHRQRPMFALMLLPLGAVALPWIMAEMSKRVPAFATDGTFGRLARNGTELVPLLAILPTLGIFMISFKVALTAPRAFCIFVPYVVLLTAAGIEPLFRLWTTGVATGGALAAILATSVQLERHIPESPRDYQKLGVEISARLQPKDIILAPVGGWLYTPTFLYLPHERLVPTDRAAWLIRERKVRVWILEFEGDTFKEGLRMVAGYEPVARVWSLRAAATLYAPPPGSQPSAGK